MLLSVGAQPWTIHMVLLFGLLFAANLRSSNAQRTQLCLTNSKTGGLLYRINETEGPDLPNLILDMSRDLYGDPSQIQLTLIENPGNYFRLQGKQLLLQRSVDREALSSNVLSLRLLCNYESAGLKFQNEIPIGVLIDDVNDNGPTFQNTPYFVEVPEVVPTGQTVFTGIFATDNDATSPNNRIEYRIKPNAGTPAGAENYFFIPDRSRSNLLLKRKLDYNSNQKYHLIIAASDNPGGSPSNRLTAETTLQVNVVQGSTGPPTFVHPSCRGSGGRTCANVEYTTAVHAGQDPLGAGMLQIRPTAILAKNSGPLNTPIVYSFVNGTPSDYKAHFAINPDSGQVVQLRRIEYGSATQYVLTVKAEHRGNPNSASLAVLKIVVDSSVENRFDPVLRVSATQGFIEETAPIGTTVRISDLPDAEPLQILVTDDDLGIDKMDETTIKDIFKYVKQNAEQILGKPTTAETVQQFVDNLKNYMVTYYNRIGAAW